MWLMIYKTHRRPELVGRVAGYAEVYPPEDTCPRDRFDVKEWDGPPPNLGDLDAGILPDFDPTLDDPGYQDKVQQRLDFEALADKATTEIAWLEETIPLIDTMTLEELRGVLRRLAQENAEMIRAWRYVIRRLR